MSRDRPKATRWREVRPPAREPARIAPTGPARYTVERFLSDCCESTERYLRENWAEGNQLLVDEIPTDALPPVVMLACYARQYGVDLVDDYTVLLDRYWEEAADFYHPDKFFSSSILVMDETGAVPEEVSFETINIPAIYEELLP